MFFFLHRIEKVELLAAFEALHVPMRKGPIDWISQDDEQFDFRIVFPNPFHCRFPVNVNRRALAGDGPGTQLREALVE